MDKYAVDEGKDQEQLEKAASQGCPSCGAPAGQLQQHGSVLICPHCGSAPFESNGSSRGRTTSR